MKLEETTPEQLNIVLLEENQKLKQRLVQSRNLVEMVSGFRHCINRPDRLLAVFNNVDAYLERERLEDK